MVKNPLPNAEDIRNLGPIPRLERSPGGGHGNATPVFLSGDSHGQRNLEGYKVLEVHGVTESDTIEVT